MSDENVNPNGNTPPAGDGAPPQNPNPAAVENPSAQVPANNGGDDKPVTYSHDSKSPQLNHAVNHFVNGLGLSYESPEVQEFLRNGNVDYLKGHVVSKGGDVASIEPFIALGIAGRTELTASAEAAEKALLAEVQGYAGGEAEWKGIAEYIKANATEEEMDAFDAILDKGGPGARMLVEGFKARMQYDPNVTKVGKDAVSPNAAATAADGPKQYTTKAEWRAAQRALISQHGYGKYENTPEGRALMAAYHPGLQ